MALLTWSWMMDSTLAAIRVRAAWPACQQMPAYARSGQDFCAMPLSFATARASSASYMVSSLIRTVFFPESSVPFYSGQNQVREESLTTEPLLFLQIRIPIRAPAGSKGQISGEVLHVQCTSPGIAFRFMRIEDPTTFCACKFSATESDTKTQRSKPKSRSSEYIVSWSKRALAGRALSLPERQMHSHLPLSTL